MVCSVKEEKYEEVVEEDWLWVGDSVDLIVKWNWLSCEKRKVYSSGDRVY